MILNYLDKVDVHRSLVLSCLAMSGLHLQYRYFFPLKICFHDFSVKNYLILHAKQSKLGSESIVSCLKQSGEMSNFCLK